MKLEKSCMSGIFLSPFAALLPSTCYDIYVKNYIAVKSHGGKYNKDIFSNWCEQMVEEPVPGRDSLGLASDLACAE